jgi:acyl carrier protein
VSEAYPPAEGPAIRRGGVYLVTGGTGGLGLEVAKGLARTGLRPKLVLVSRGAEPDEPRTRAAVEELQALGAEVRVQACDVADARSLARVLDVTAVHFGPVNGVLHLAGVPGNGMLAVRRREDAEAVLHPKVRATLVLLEALAQRPPLDFFVGFSSRAAVTGMVGSGDYAAGNAFLDAVLARPHPRVARTLSIDWPGWHTVGMARERYGEHHRHEVVLADDRTWALDEHRVDGRAVLPGTGHLDLVVAGFLELTGEEWRRPVVLEDVMFSRPMSVTGRRRVRVTYRRDGDRWRFASTSQPATADGPDEGWDEHATGFIAELPDGAPAAPEKTPVEAVQARLSAAPVPSTDGAADRLFVLGPRWSNLASVWAGEQEKLVELRLPDAFADDLKAHAVHPALLDSATASVRDADADALHLPFMYRRLVLRGPLPMRFYSHIRRVPAGDRMIRGDISLVAPDGTVIGEIDGYTMRRVERDAFSSADAAPVPAPAQDADAERGLAPEAGVDLLLTLLATRTAEVVMVRPHENGAPVPLKDSGAAAGAGLATTAEVRAGAPALRPQPSRAAPAERPASDPAPSGLSDRMRALWSEVLGIEDITDGTDFFEAGGDSLSAVHLMGRIRDVFQIELSIGALFDYPTLAEIVGALKAQGAK